MISTTEGELWSNRGNALLEAVLRSRYPGLATPEALEQLAGVLYYPGALEAAGGQVHWANTNRLLKIFASGCRRRLQRPGGNTMGHLGTRDGWRVKNRGEGSRARLHRQQDDDRGGHHPLHSTSYLTIPGAVAPLISKQ